MYIPRIKASLALFALITFVFVARPVMAETMNIVQTREAAWSVNELPMYRMTGVIPVDAVSTLTNNQTGVTVEHKLIYSKRIKGDVTSLFISPATPPSPGTYTFTYAESSTSTSAYSDVFTWSSESDDTHAFSLTRSALPAIIKPNVSYRTQLTIEAHEDVSASIVERIPFDAVPTATDASIIKRPELLNLARPFDGDYPVSLEFGHVNPVDHFNIPYHDGTDYAVPTGTTIRAVDDGEIIPYREVNSYGITVAIQHAWGRTYYGHLASSEAQIGQHVKRGDAVGISGNTGLSSGPHLHFTMVWGDEQIIDGHAHVTRSLPPATNQKELVWPLSMKKGEVKTIEYSFALTNQQDSDIVTNTFGPAILMDQQIGCRPFFVSQALMTHYAQNDELSTGQTDNASIPSCKTLTTLQYPITILSSNMLGQYQSSHTQNIDKISQLQPENVPSVSTDPEASNVSKKSIPARITPYPTTYLDDVSFWYNPYTKSIEGVDEMTDESFTKRVGQDGRTELTLDISSFAVTVLPNNTLQLAKLK